MKWKREWKDPKEDKMERKEKWEMKGPKRGQIKMRVRPLMQKKTKVYPWKDFKWGMYLDTGMYHLIKVREW